MIRRSRSARERHVNAKHSTPDSTDVSHQPPKSTGARDVLPPLPRPEVAMSSERPSTAGDSAHHRSNRSLLDVNATRKLDNRVSRDDSWLVMRGPRSGLTKGRTASPDVSPRSSLMTPGPRFAMTDAEIGVALGSPTHASAASSPWAPRGPQSSSTPSSSAMGFHSGPGEPQRPRKSSGKWKLFGLFGRKTSEPANRSISTPDMYYQEAYAPRQAREEKDYASPQRPLREKPPAIRSQTMPESGMSTSDRWHRSAADAAVQDSRAMSAAPPPVKKDKASTPLLNVEINNAPLERYSIMFGSVLNQSQNRASLLSRRQANVQHLQVIDDTMEEGNGGKQGRPRRATSPDPTQTEFSNVYSLTPPNTRQLNKPHRLSPIARSSTSPAFIQAVAEERSSPLKGNSGGARSIANGLPRHPAQGRPQFSPEVSSLILESPVDVEEGSLHGDEPGFPHSSATQTVPSRAPPAPPSHHQAQHTAPSTASSSVSSIRGGIGGRRSPSTASSSALTAVTQPSPQQEDSQHGSYQTPPLFCLDERDNVINTAHMSPVEVSIARQISISRQQRNMLLQSSPSSSSPHENAQAGGSPRPRAATNPTNTANRPAPHRNASHARFGPHQGLGVVIPQKAQLGQSERMGETRSSTPTIVTPPTERYAGSGESPLAQHRKSSRIVLETA